MDKDVIDVTHMSEEDRREHFRRMEQLMTCPCVNCTAICDRWAQVHSCEPYQDWLAHNKPRRGNGK